MASEREAEAALPGLEIQELWFALVKREWSSLILLPAHRGGSALALAHALAQLARVQRGNRVRVLDASKAELRQTAQLIVEMTSFVRDGGTCFVAADAVVENQAGIPLAFGADAAVLCVSLGQSDLSSARRTLELVGESRFIGCVTLEP